MIPSPSSSSPSSPLSAVQDNRFVSAAVMQEALVELDHSLE